jgi:hypothetical protein
MNKSRSMDVDALIAIDVHVHIEHGGENSPAEQAAKRYSGEGGKHDRDSLAEYYRSRKIGCVVFPVDETLTGRPLVSNDSVAEFAAANADIAIAFASINPRACS